MDKKESRQWTYWLSFAVVVIIIAKIIDWIPSIGGVCTSLISVAMPFLLAILVAYILYIPCKSIEKAFNNTKIKLLYNHSRGLSVFTTYLICILIIFIICNFVMPNIYTSIKDLVTNIPSYYGNALEYLDNLDENSILKQIHVNEYARNLTDIEYWNGIINYLSLDNIGMYISGITGFTGAIFNAFVVLIVSIYMLLERNDIKSFLSNLCNAMFSNKVYKTLAEYFRKTNSIFFSFIAGQLFDAFAVGIITSIVMLIMNVKYGVLLGFMIGLFNMIPYFGAIFAITISILITIFTGGLVQALTLGVIIIVLQQIDANILNPKILGKTLDISPILIIFAVTFGGEYFGVLGMFLGVPVIAFVKLVLSDYIDYKIKKKQVDNLFTENE